MARLNFGFKGTEYESKEFDFKAMCLVNEGHNDEKRNCPLMMCEPAVEYLFSEDLGVLEKLPLNQRCKLCTDCWDIYIAELTAKND